EGQKGDRDLLGDGVHRLALRLALAARLWALLLCLWAFFLCFLATQRTLPLAWTVRLPFGQRVWLVPCFGLPGPSKTPEPAPGALEGWLEAPRQASPSQFAGRGVF